MIIHLEGVNWAMYFIPWRYYDQRSDEGLRVTWRIRIGKHFFGHWGRTLEQRTFVARR